MKLIQIDAALIDYDFFNDYDLEILTLPKKEESKQELNVIENSTNNEIDAVELFKSCDCYYINHTSQNEKEEHHNEFEPFVSKVLVRLYPDSLWTPAFFFSEESEGDSHWYHVVGNPFSYNECIPYEGNEQLAFTTINPELNK